MAVNALIDNDVPVGQADSHIVGGAPSYPLWNTHRWSIGGEPDQGVDCHYQVFE